MKPLFKSVQVRWSYRGVNLMCIYVIALLLFEGAIYFALLVLKGRTPDPQFFINQFYLWVIPFIFFAITLELLHSKTLRIMAFPNHVDFYFENLRKGWSETGRQAREHHLYHPHYCGCLLSREEAAKQRRSNADRTQRGRQ